MSAATLVAAVLCLCLCAQAAPAMVVQLNRDAVVALNENVVIARLNPEAVARITGQTLTGTLNIDAVKPVDTTKPIIARLNPEAVARITGQPLIATLNINAVKPVQAQPLIATLNINAVKPVQAQPLVATLNINAVKPVQAKPVQMEVNMAALKAASAKPVQMELNMAALKAATAPVGLEVDLENFGSEALKSVFPGKLSSFSYTDCAKASAPAHVSQFSLTPDPVQIPGNITISLKASLATNQSAPIKASIKLQKKSKIGTWNTIPCIDNVGSCTYDDLCAVLEKNIPLVDGQCPPEFIEHNAPCRCPIPSGQISVAGLSVAIPKLPPSIPSFLLSGDFQVNVQLFDNTNTQMFCLNVFVTLSDN